MHPHHPQQAYPQQPHQPAHVPYPAQAQAPYPAQAHYPAQAPYPANDPSAPTQYEFGDAENKTIGTTAGRARAWGVISLLLGVGQLLLAFANTARASDLAQIIQASGGAVSIVVGVVFIGVSASLESVVKSRGNDVALMMAALQKLSMAFGIQIGVAVVGFVVGAVFGAMGAM